MQDWQPYPVDPYSCYICDHTCIHNPLLLSVVNDTDGLVASAMGFAPGMWLDALLYSGNGFGAVISEIAFATADFDCNEFPHISKIETPPNSFVDAERSQYQDVLERL